jgi:hypothetical protein
MKKSAGSILAVIAGLVITQELKATVIFSDNFNGYNNGALVGQGGWLQTSTSTVNPLQVNSGVLSVGNTGQDAYSAFGSAVSTTAGGSMFIGLDLDVTAAASTGDYFLHVGSTVGGTSGFYDKIWVKSSGSGFVLGSQDNNGTVTYGTTVLSLGTDYRLVTEEDFVTGAANDTFAFYVDPTDTSVAANNTAYLTATWSGTTAEASSYAEINIRQGTATAAATETVDNLVVGTAFSDVSAVPEPSTMAMAALGGVAWLVALRRRK